MEAILKFPDSSKLLDETKGIKFRQTIGSLQYLTETRPDIAYSVNKMSQFMVHPTVGEW